MRQFLIVPELRELLAANDEASIRSFCESSHPATVAELLSGLESFEIWRILHMIPVARRAEIFSHFELSQQVELATGENRRDMAKLLEEMDPDERADLVQRLDEQVREELLPLVARAEREDIRRLASYEQGTAGAVMNTDYAVLKADMTVPQALEQVRIQAPRKETIYYIYVIDDQRRLVGFVSIRDLILAKPTQTVGDIMHRDIISVHITDDQEEVVRKIEKYDLLAIPVVNGNNILVGIVTHDDAIHILRQEQQEDVEKLMAIVGKHAAREYLRTPVWTHFRNRAVWIVALAILGLISGLIVQNFKELLVQFTILAAFMPMLADTGGNTGSQSATLVVRALALQEIRLRDVGRVLWKEFRVSILLAALLAIVAFGRVIVFGGGSTNPVGTSIMQIAFAVSVALGLQVVSATLIGALLPLGAARMKWDPAVVASPAVTTIVDITGLLIYFITAKALLGV